MRTARTSLIIKDGGITILDADTLDFLGAGVAVTDGGNGTANITINGGGGGADIYTEEVTAVTSGDNVTIDLTQLDNAFTTILFPTRNGAVLGTTDPGDGSSYWSRTSNTMTVYNAVSTDKYLVTYTV